MSSEQIVTVVTGIFQAGGVGVFVYYLVRGLRTKIASLEGVISTQNETLKVMEKRIVETEKVGQIYKDLLSGLPKDLDNYKAVISKTKDEMILQLENSNKIKDEQIKKIGVNDASETARPQNGSSKHLEAMRFLVDQKNESFRKFVIEVCGDIDVAVDALVKAQDFDSFLSKENLTPVIEDSKQRWEQMMRPPDGSAPIGLRIASWSNSGWHAIYDDGRFIISTTQRNQFSMSFRNLKAKLTLK